MSEDKNFYEDNYDDNYGYEESDNRDRLVRKLQILIAVLAVVLAALAIVYFTQTHRMRVDFAIERDTLTSRISTLMTEYDNLTTENDSISRSLDIERSKADSLLQRLKKERSLSYSKMRRYEKELGTLRAVMRNYVRQIDSLNQINKKLTVENVKFRKQVTSERLRADMAEERSEELSNKIKIGSVVRARDIQLIALTGKDRSVTRMSRAERLRVDFILSSNDLTTPGAREVYMRITSPEGYVLFNSSDDVFEFEGEMLSFSASREVDYQNKDLSVSIYYKGSNFSAGKYKVDLYMDGRLVGSNEFVFR